MATQKQYIGNGKATKFNGVSVTIRLEDAQPHVRTTESGSWLSFIVSPKLQVDEKGRTHSAFILTAPQEPAAPEVMAEPAPSMETPVGAVVTKGGKRMRRISAKEAAAKRAALADMKA